MRKEISWSKTNLDKLEQFRWYNLCEGKENTGVLNTLKYIFLWISIFHYNKLLRSVYSFVFRTKSFTLWVIYLCLTQCAYIFLSVAEKVIASVVLKHMEKNNFCSRRKTIDGSFLLRPKTIRAWTVLFQNL